MSARTWLLALATLSAVAGCAGAAAAQTVPTYHGAANRSGLYVTPGLTWANAGAIHMDPGFHGKVAGAVYAQPLYWVGAGAPGGLVIVATEANIVYALDPASGAVVWQRPLGAPVTLSRLPCGNINPVGVTGTPVIDEASATLYLDALVASGGGRHKIFAIALATGKILAGWPVDVENGLTALHAPFLPTAQQQRSGLADIAGNIYVNYGGNWGDCSTYHGTVIELATGTPKITAMWQTRAAGGGIWGQSGIAYDGQSMFLATGNTFGASAWGDGEAVIRLQPGLKHSLATTDYFAPATWQTLDRDDLDLGGTAPLPIDVPQGSVNLLKRVLALGKDGNAYLLDRGNLGGIGRQIAMAHVANDEIITGPASYRTASATMVAMVGAGAACPAGQGGNLVMLRIATGANPISTAWCAPLNGTGAPIITAGQGNLDPIVWVAGAQGDKQLHGFRASDGAVLFNGGGAADVMAAGLQRNTTILVADERLYVAGNGAVYAFRY
jgi:outer membrane protein assembly factor BamB